MRSGDIVMKSSQQDRAIFETFAVRGEKKKKRVSAGLDIPSFIFRTGRTMKNTQRLSTLPSITQLELD